MIAFLDECFIEFDNNNYPIIIIENFNNGGSSNLANYFASYIINNFISYSSLDTMKMWKKILQKNLVLKIWIPVKLN